MDKTVSFEKLQVIYELLFTLAMGRRPPTYTPRSVVDHTDLLLVQLLEFGTQLQNLEATAGIDPASDSFIRITYFEFLLDADLMLVHFNKSASNALGYPQEYLESMPFTALLTVSSQEEWRSLLQLWKPDETVSTSLNLIFVSNTLQLLPLFCTVTALVNNSLILVTSSKTFCVEAIIRKQEMAQVHGKRSVRFINALHDYILNHLEEPLPPLKKLAALLGTEQTRLKLVFRTYYNCSPYQFYQEERLKKAHELIQHTPLELKQIAFMCGFTTYMNFYKVFKKRFGHAPSELQRLFVLREGS